MEAAFINSLLFLLPTLFLLRILKFRLLFNATLIIYIFAISGLFVYSLLTVILSLLLMLFFTSQKDAFDAASVISIIGIAIFVANTACYKAKEFVDEFNYYKEDSEKSSIKDVAIFIFKNRKNFFEDLLNTIRDLKLF